VDQETEAAVREWARLFNEGRYFEAHEVLERPWLLAPEPEKAFLKGLIHAAVALHHYRHGNGHGARVKHASSVRYLSGFHPCFVNVDVAGLVRQMEAFFQELLSQPSGSPPPPPRVPWPAVTVRGEGS
jgi:predicted metal-dependent hydrolase